MSANLSVPTTPFVGRERELGELAALLADPACRLITLVGPGGIGKTRLAAELARSPNLARSFPDGIFFVPLVGVAGPTGVEPAVAAAGGFAFFGNAPPRKQLLDYLRDKTALLILDNFEHLMAAADLAPEVIAAAPGVKLLVTSREVLSVRDEWRYPLEGLPVPPEDPPADASPPDALTLFAERARRVRRGFDLAAEREQVARICRLVEGTPLAIELAASWLGTLSCTDVADEIARGVALLATGLRDVPERHRSMQAVFEHSWRLLTAAEQAALRRLAVFVGGFSREAASAVLQSGADDARLPTLDLLAALVERSLLRAQAGGRYHMHELPRQYAAALLAQGGDEERAARRAHAAYYAGFLAARFAALTGAGQRAATQEIAAELGNIRAAWQHSVAQGDAAAIRGAAHPLALFHIFRGPFHEGIAALEAGVAVLRAAPDAALAGALVDLAWLYLRVGRLEDARAVLVESQALLDTLGVAPPPGRATDPLLVLGDLAMVRGDYVAAARCGEEARRRSERHGQRTNLPYAWYALTEAALAQGLYEQAQGYAQSAYAAVQVSQDRWYAAYIHSELGHVAVARGAYAVARQHYQASYALREEFDDPQGMAEALGHLARVALAQADYGEASDAYRHSCAIYRRTGDRGGLARALGGLGLAACRSGDIAAAQQHLRQAFALAAELRFVPLLLAILASAAEALLRAGQQHLAVELLALILRHPASERETSDRSQRLLFEAEGVFAQEQFAALLARAQTLELDTAIARLQPSLAAESAAAPARLPAPAAIPAARAPLVEPLTGREIDVLRRIAAGRSNQQIADELVLALGTVKWYVSQIYGKLAVRSRTQALVRARALGLIE